MKTFLPNFVFKELSTYAAIIVIFVHNNVLDKNLECTCNPEDIDCSFYMAMPFFIIFILKLWSDKKFQRALKYTCTCNCCNWCTKKRCKFFWVLSYHIVKAAFIGLLWVASVLIEGDWYVCCRNDHSEQQKQLACKDKKNITDKDQTRITELKNHSKVIGLSLLFSVLLVASLMSSFGEKCCKKSNCCDRKLPYYKVILDEEKKVLKETLTTAVKKKLTEAVESKIHGEQWEGCFDVATELIENNTGPGAAGANQDGIPLEKLQPEGDPLLSTSPGSSGEQ